MENTSNVNSNVNYSLPNKSTWLTHEVIIQVRKLIPHFKTLNKTGNTEGCL